MTLKWWKREKNKNHRNFMMIKAFAVVSRNFQRLHHLAWIHIKPIPNEGEKDLSKWQKIMWLKAEKKFESEEIEV